MVQTPPKSATSEPGFASALRQEIGALRAENAILTKALTGLTCGGSEFFIRKGDRYTADVDACVAYVRRKFEDSHRRTVEAITRAQDAEAALAQVTTPSTQDGQGPVDHPPGGQSGPGMNPNPIPTPEV